MRRRGPRDAPRGGPRNDRPLHLRHARDVRARRPRRYAVALNLVRDGDRLYYHAATEGLKAELLRQNPKVCALFVDGAAVDEPGLTTYYASAVVRGTAREITDADEKAPGAAPALRALRAEHSGGKDFVHRERPPLTPRSGASKSNR